jgi:hypothetical protein
VEQLHLDPLRAGEADLLDDVLRRRAEGALVALRLEDGLVRDRGAAVHVDGVDLRRLRLPGVRAQVAGAGRRDARRGGGEAVLERQVDRDDVLLAEAAVLRVELDLVRQLRDELEGLDEIRAVLVLEVTNQSGLVVD